jgi:hypothetical protein
MSPSNCSDTMATVPARYQETPLEGSLRNGFTSAGEEETASVPS